IFFYLPESFFKQRPQEHSWGQSILFERGERMALDSFLAENRFSYILTDAERGKALLASSPDITIEAKRDRWLLLECEPGQSHRVAHRGLIVPGSLPGAVR